MGFEMSNSIELISSTGELLEEARRRRQRFEGKRQIWAAFCKHPSNRVDVMRTNGLFLVQSQPFPASPTPGLNRLKQKENKNNAKPKYDLSPNSIVQNRPYSYSLCSQTALKAINGIHKMQGKPIFYFDSAYYHCRSICLFIFVSLSLSSLLSATLSFSFSFSSSSSSSSQTKWTKLKK